MLQRSVRRMAFGLTVLVAIAASAIMHAAEWVVPLGGNAYVVQSPAGVGDGLQRGGTVVRWRNPATVFAVFVHVDRGAVIGSTTPAGSRVSFPETSDTATAAHSPSAFQRPSTTSAISRA